MADAMLFDAGIVLGLAVLSGITLVALYQWGAPAGRVWWPGAVHGLFGLAGSGWLLLALRGTTRGEQSGAGSFGAIAAVGIAGALVLGGAVALTRWRGRRPSNLMLGVHATLAVAGLTMLAAYVSAP